MPWAIRDTTGFKLRLSEGVVGRVVDTQQAIVIGDVTTHPDYIEVVPGIASTVAVPLIHKSKPIGALNLLSRERDRYSDRDATILRQFAAHVAMALVNARLFERQRLDAEAFELLAEIGREVASVLDLDELLSRIAQLTRRVIDYRTFGILLLNEKTKELEMKVAVQYGEKVALPTVPLGEGLVGYAALHREPVLVPDVSKDPRYIKVVEDVRSELAIPMLLKDRCIGVFDLEQPRARRVHQARRRDPDAACEPGGRRDRERAALRRSHRRTKRGSKKSCDFAKRVQAALLPSQLPKRLKGVDLAAQFAPARELGGDFHDFLLPDSNTLIVAFGDVSGKGTPAALYSVFAGELVRGRTFRRRYLPERSSPGNVLMSINTILHERQLEEYYCTLCYALVRSQTPDGDARQLRRAVSHPRERRHHQPDRAARRATRVVLRRHLRRALFSARVG